VNSPAAKPWPIVAAEIERNVLHGDRYIIEGLDKVQPNAKVCIDVQADRFCSFLFHAFKESNNGWGCPAEEAGRRFRISRGKHEASIL